MRTGSALSETVLRRTGTCVKRRDDGGERGPSGRPVKLFEGMNGGDRVHLIAADAFHARTLDTDREMRARHVRALDIA